MKSAAVYFYKVPSLPLWFAGLVNFKSHDLSGGVKKHSTILLVEGQTQQSVMKLESCCTIVP